MRPKYRYNQGVADTARLANRLARTAIEQAGGLSIIELRCRAGRLYEMWRPTPCSMEEIHTEISFHHLLPISHSSALLPTEPTPY